jgi:hypothetical protein
MLCHASHGTSKIDGSSTMAKLVYGTKKMSCYLEPLWEHIVNLGNILRTWCAPWELDGKTLGTQKKKKTKNKKQLTYIDEMQFKGWIKRFAMHGMHYEWWLEMW